MKHWQEKRNYQHVRDEAGNVRSNIITVDGIDVEVSDEVYLAYTQLDRRERYLAAPQHIPVTRFTCLVLHDAYGNFSS